MMRIYRIASIVVLLIIGILSSNRVLGISITGLVFATIILILFLVKADEQFRNMQEGKKDYKKIFRISVVVSLLILISINAISNIPCVASCVWWNTFYGILNSLAISALAGFAVALLVDTPELVRTFGETIKDVMGSDDYLNNLSPDKLKGIRNKASHILHSGDGKMPETFASLDEKLSELIGKPYYGFLNESIICHEKSSYFDIVKKMDENYDEKEPVSGIFFQKDVCIEYSIVNPQGAPKAEADIGLCKYLDLPDKCEFKYAFILEDFEVSIDGEDYIDISPNTQIVVCRKKNGAHKSNDPNTMTYNSILRLRNHNTDCVNRDYSAKTIGNDIPKYIETQSDSKAELLASFQNIVSVKIKYKQICPSSDSHYTRRLKYPAQTYMISYHTDDNMLLHGQIIGTLINQADVSITQSTDKDLIIVCRNWLLPMNGSFIVMDDKISEDS